MDKQCPWTELGLRPGASTEQIEDAFRRLALRYHPDRNGGCEAAADNFRRINAAVQQLRDMQANPMAYRAKAAAAAAASSHSPRAARYRYGAQYSEAPGAKESVRRPMPARTAAALRGVGLCAAGLFALGAWKVTHEREQHARTYAAWVARDEARSRERSKRPPIGKGRRRAQREEGQRSETST